MFNFLRKIKRMMREYIEYFMYCLKHFYHKKKSLVWSKKPLENKIVFCNFNGKGYGCNPKYIAEEIIHRNLNYDLVWLVSDDDYFVPKEIRKVKFFSSEACMELSTAKIIINNVKGELNFKKRKDQFYIQTWHAGFSVKKLEKEARKSLPLSYIKESKDESKITDMIVSNSKLQSEDYKNNFWCKAEIFECGLPRNDIYTNCNNEKYILSIKEKLSIPQHYKLLLFAPTFRGGENSYESYDFDPNVILKFLETTRNGKWMILSRFHPNVHIENSLNTNNIRDVSYYSDTQDLLLISDILVTDYSSVMFEFTQMRKEVYLYIPDFDEYKKIRGFKKAFYELELPRCKTFEELKESIKSFDEKKYAIISEQLRKKYSEFDRGNAASLIVDRIEKIMNK